MSFTFFKSGFDETANIRMIPTSNSQTILQNKQKEISDMEKIPDNNPSEQNNTTPRPK